MDNSDDSRALEKKALRKALVEQRLNMADRHQRSALLQDVMRIWLVGRPDTVIGAYWPIKGEFDPLPALHRWKEDGELLDQPQLRRIGLPVVDKVHKTMVFHAWYPGCRMEEDAYGIPKPKDTEVIVPTLLFISHDLSIVRYLSDRVLVMYLGHVVELGTTDQVFAPPYHPYTEALLSAVPIADTRIEKKRIVLEGDIPSAVNPPPGCPFQTRCRWKSQVAGGLCDREMPPMRKLGDGHQIKCHLSEAELAGMEPVFKIAAE